MSHYLNESCGVERSCQSLESNQQRMTEEQTRLRAAVLQVGLWKQQTQSSLTASCGVTLGESIASTLCFAYCSGERFLAVCVCVCVLCVSVCCV